MKTAIILTFAIIFINYATTTSNLVVTVGRTQPNLRSSPQSRLTLLLSRPRALKSMVMSWGGCAQNMTGTQGPKVEKPAMATMGGAAVFAGR
jgi:hypothetical protein